MLAGASESKRPSAWGGQEGRSSHGKPAPGTRAHGGREPREEGLPSEVEDCAWHLGPSLPTSLEKSWTRLGQKQPVWHVYTPW